jgi:hypothetical protein
MAFFDNIDPFSPSAASGQVQCSIGLPWYCGQAPGQVIGPALQMPAQKLAGLGKCSIALLSRGGSEPGSPVDEAELAELCTDTSGKCHGTSIPPPLIRPEVVADFRRSARAELASPMADVLSRLWASPASIPLTPAGPPITRRCT